MGENHRGGSHCRICVKGLVDPAWSDWFDGLEIRHQSNGTTLLEGPLCDQATLHGYLTKIRDLALPLLSVHLDTRT